VSLGDPKGIESLASALEQLADTATSAVGAVAGALGATEWCGSGAEAFFDQWAHLSRQVTEAAEEARRAAGILATLATALDDAARIAVHAELTAHAAGGEVVDGRAVADVLGRWATPALEAGLEQANLLLELANARAEAAWITAQRQLDWVTPPSIEPLVDLPGTTTALLGGGRQWVEHLDSVGQQPSWWDDLGGWLRSEGSSLAHVGLDVATTAAGLLGVVAGAAVDAGGLVLDAGGVTLPVGVALDGVGTAVAVASAGVAAAGTRDLVLTMARMAPGHEGSQPASPGSGPDVSNPESFRGATREEAIGAIPEDWDGPYPLRKGSGLRWFNPTVRGQTVFIEDGSPGADNIHGGPYIKISLGDGPPMRVPLAGNPVLFSDGAP